MRVNYLRFLLCLQIALINAGAGDDDSEHVHIKVLVPHTARKQARLRSAHQKKFPHLDSPPHPPYGDDFDFFGGSEAATNEDYGGYATDPVFNYGPVLFNNEIAATTPSSSMMRQLLTPAEMMMSLMTAANGGGKAANTLDESGRLTPEGSDLFAQYLKQFNEQQVHNSQKYSNRIMKKRKKNIYDEEPITHDDEQQNNFQPSYYITPQTTTYRRRHQFSHQNHHNAEPPPISNPFQWTYDSDDSGEFETAAAEDISSSAASESNEHVRSAFSKLNPISYQDMLGAYATPLARAAATHLSGQSYTHHHQQQQTTEPNWRQYHYEQQYRQQQKRPELQHHQHRQKSHPTQFVLPTTTFGLTTLLSPSLSSSSHSSPSSPSSSASATSPINGGFRGGAIASAATLPWISPHDFVQQSQQQQQLHSAQQHGYKLQKLSSKKKRKNRNKPKRTRFALKKR